MNIRFTIDKDGQGIVDIYDGDEYKHTVYCNNYMLLDCDTVIEDVFKCFPEVQWSIDRVTGLYHALVNTNKTLLWTDKNNVPYFKEIDDEDNL